MTPANRLSPEPGDYVLDLCAAPGGKATELGAKLNGEGLLLANDISNSRAKALLKNLELPEGGPSGQLSLFDRREKGGYTDPEDAGRLHPGGHGADAHAGPQGDSAGALGGRGGLRHHRNPGGRQPV